jgi:hypothetical protein
MKNPLKHLFAIVVCSFLFLLACTTIPAPRYSDLRMTVRVATILYIGDSQQKADDALQLVTKIQHQIDKFDVVSVEALMQYVRKEIVWQKLKPIEAVTIDELLLRIERSINEEIIHAQVPPDTKVIVYDVLTWMKEALLMSRTEIAEKQERVLLP